MSNRAAVERECDRANEVRRVFQGKVDHNTFFTQITGDLLISGNGACSPALLADMVERFSDRKEMPTLLLTSHGALLELLERRKAERLQNDIVISGSESRNYQPMYGMSAQQISRLVKAAGEELGYTRQMDKISIYTKAVLNVVEKHYPLSFASIYQLLLNEDEFIAQMGMQDGLPGMIRDNILGNRGAGICVRRIFEYLEETFENIATNSGDTHYNFQSGVSQRLSVMALYQPSYNQEVMNLYLKEELHGVIRRVPRVRVILDEVIFQGETDGLLNYLLELKRQRKAELVVCSQNALEMLCKKVSDFKNVCLFQHASTTVTEELSESVFGKFPYRYPALTRGMPPTFLFTLKKDEHWGVATEDRLRVRAVDLYSEQRLLGRIPEKAAVYTGNERIYLVPREEFLYGEKYFLSRSYDRATGGEENERRHF